MSFTSARVFKYTTFLAEIGAICLRAATLHTQLGFS